MKTIALLSFLAFFVVSCKKDAAKPQITFTNNIASGTANANGEYTITGHISSPIRIDSVTLTKGGQSSPFLIDASTSKNKNEYDFSYLVTGITATSSIEIIVFDQAGGEVTYEFLINH
jgi:hypothetical protein